MQRNNPIPEALVRCPSDLINDMADYISHTSFEYVPQFSLISALTMSSHFYGRQYQSEWKTQVSICSILVAPSGTGKNYCRKALYNFEELHTNIIGGATSDSGLFSALHGNPNVLMISDEIGGKMNSKDPAAKNLWLFINDLFNTSVALDKSYAKRVNGVIQEDKKYMIKNPSLSILGMSTPGLITNNLSYDDIEGGSLNRFCIVNAFPDEIIRNTTGITDNPSDHLIQSILISGSNLLGRNNQDSAPKSPHLKTVKFTPGDADRLYHKSIELRFHKNSVYSVRLIETAIKISLVLTVSMKLDVIPSYVLDWSYDYVKYWLYNVKKLSEESGKNDYSKTAEKITNKIKSYKDSGMEQHNLNAFVRRVGWNEYQRRAFLNDLIDDRIIEKTLGPKNLKNGTQKKLIFYIGDKRK